MAKIHSLTIKNFRGISNFSQVFKTNFICLIGRGDSGKSTILEAISLVLSPNWNTTFFDNDFYKCNTSNQIEIEATIKDLPIELITEDKFGAYLYGLEEETDKIESELQDHHEKVIVIKFEIGKDLEPQWNVIC